MYVDRPFGINGVPEFNFEKFREDVRVFTRLLDNVVELNGLPLEQQRDEILSKRRHGMGFMGLGSLLNILGIPYGSQGAIELTKRISKELAVTGFQEGVKLAKEKSPAPLLKSKENRKKWAEGQYMAKIWSVDPDLRKDALKYGCRFTHHSSIAPTGCLIPSTSIRTSKGTLTLEEIFKRNKADMDPLKEDTWFAPLEEIMVETVEGPRRITKLYTNRVSPTLKVSTKSMEIEGTLNHKVLVKVSETEAEWKRLDDLKVGDKILRKRVPGIGYLGTAS